MLSASLAAGRSANCHLRRCTHHFAHHSPSQHRPI